MVDYRFSLLANLDSKNISLDNILIKFNMDRNEFLLKFTHLNSVIKELDYEVLVIQDNSISIPNTFKERWIDIFLGKKEEFFILEENQRKAMIFLMIFMEEEELSVFHFQDFLKVSRNTILSDIKNLRSFLKIYNLKIIYSRKNGFYIRGEEDVIRSTAYSFVTYLLSHDIGKRVLYTHLFKSPDNLYNDICFELLKIKKNSSLIVVPSRLEEMTYFLPILFYRISNALYDFTIQNSNFIRTLRMYTVVEQFISFFSIEFKSEDIEYLTILFMICMQGNISDPSLDFLMSCASEMIYEIERLAVVHFKNFKKILVELFYHLVPSYFRIEYDLPIENGLVESIKIQYKELYELTCKAVHPLELLTKKKIPQEEIGYYTILFGGEILNFQKEEVIETLEAVIICPSGVSSSVLMKSELQKLFPSISFKETTSITNFNNSKIEDEIDIVFSNVPIKSTKKVYVLKTIMTQLEKSLLVRKVQEDFFLQEYLTPTSEDILDIILPYIELKKGITREKLYDILQKKININIIEKEDNRPMLSELLSEDMIEIVDSQQDWETAIQLAAEPLKKKNMISDTYVDAMIKKVKDYGPFINIGKGVALPHARPEDGVNKLGMSLLKLNKPVLLCNDENHSINLFICLAAVDNETHLKALASLTKILSNKEKLSRLLDATTKKEIMTIINEGEDEK